MLKRADYPRITRVTITSGSTPLSLLQTISLLIALSSASAIAQEATKAKSPENDSGESSIFLDDARKYVITSPNDRATLVLKEKSLLNWTNPQRQQERGGVYVWTLDDRPLAIASLFSYEYNEKVYIKHEFHSLSTKPLKSSLKGKVAWTPKTAGIEWVQVKDGTQPARGHNARSLQMRDISRRFRAVLNSPENERNELRLVSRPLLEYSSAKQHVLDGAIFSFAVATDPEVLLLVEAFEEEGQGPSRAAFRYGFARFHYWNVAVFEGDTKVWEAPLDKSHETNAIGSSENISKIYNSYHPNP